MRLAAIVKHIKDVTADILLPDCATPRLGFGDELEQAKLALANVVRFTAPDQALAKPVQSLKTEPADPVSRFFQAFVSWSLWWQQDFFLVTNNTAKKLQGLFVPVGLA